MGDDIIVAGTKKTVVFWDMPGRNLHIFRNMLPLNFGLAIMKVEDTHLSKEQVNS
jgi:hypothetical protein